MSLQQAASSLVPRVRIEQVRLGPAEAELRVAFPWQGADTPELRGRLMGPRCAHASTIEVAYYLKPAPVQPGQGEFVGRIIIPDPSFWDPARPHLYVGPLELWQNSRLQVGVQVSLGLRTCALGKRGLLWNGQPLPLRGCKEAGATGNNLLVASASKVTSELLATTNHEGILVLAHLHQRGDIPATPTPPPRDPSLLGWLVDAPLLEVEAMQSLLALSNRLIGLNLLDGIPAGLPRCDFLCCSAELLPAVREFGLPILLRGGDIPAGEALVFGSLAE